MKAGEVYWIIENGYNVVQAKIISVNGTLCLIHLASGVAIRVPKHRLYKTEEEADVSRPNKSAPRSPYAF